MGETTPTPELPPQFLPIISEETGQLLKEELGLDTSASTEIPISPYNSAEAIATAVFGDLITINRHVVEVINERLVALKPSPDDFSDSIRTVGMGLVLYAFQIQSGRNLIEKFDILGEEGMQQVRVSLEESLPGKYTSTSILERLLKYPRIPEQQIILNQITQQISPHSTYYTNFIKEGASSMYHLLQQFWPRFFPQNQNQPPQNTS